MTAASCVSYEDVLKTKRRKRRRLNRLRKQYDRWKPKGAPFLFDHRVKHYRENDYEFNRRKSHCETGYGVAWEHNPDAQKY